MKEFRSLPKKKYDLRLLFQATELNQAIKYMHENKMYAKLVVYIEACESGSMFKVTPIFPDILVDVHHVNIGNGSK